MGHFWYDNCSHIDCGIICHNTCYYSIEKERLLKEIEVSFFGENGPKEISIPSLPYTRSDVNNFFSHLAFEIGEHHSNKPVKQLVDALYRYVGMEPDPSHEFDGYWEEIKDDGFAIIEINIKHRVNK